VARVNLALLLFPCVLAAQSPLGLVNLRTDTAAAFDQYVAQAEARMKPEPRSKPRDGKIHIESAAAYYSEPDARVPGGMLQDWVGTIFIPSASLSQVKALLQDYETYKTFYQPEVIESKQTAHNGDEYDIFLRLYEKHVLTVVLNANYHVRYTAPDAQHLLVTSHSTRIAEVKNPGKSYTDEYTVGNDSGFLWRLNSYWRFEAADGGVYAECEAISLSRDVPFGLGFLLKGFLESFPKESMINTLQGTKQAIERHQSANPASSGQ